MAKDQNYWTEGKLLNIGYLKVLGLLSLRTITFGIAFLLTALVFYLIGADHFFIDAGPWWPVYGLFANFLCFVVIRNELRKGKIKTLSLINYQKLKIKKDLLLGLAFILVSIILAVGSAFVFGYMMYDRYPYEKLPRFTDIPDIVIIIFVIVFPIVNSVLEEITYNGFLFPVLNNKFKNTYLTISIVLFFFTLQHVFITFVPDIKYIIWRLLSFIPLLLFWIIIYSKMERLTTLILVHWFMDTFAIMSIILTPN